MKCFYYCFIKMQTVSGGNAHLGFKDSFLRERGTEAEKRVMGQVWGVGLRPSLSLSLSIFICRWGGGVKHSNRGTGDFVAG